MTMDRRQFLKRALAAAVTSLVLPALVTREALAKPKPKPKPKPDPPKPYTHPEPPMAVKSDPGLGPHRGPSAAPSLCPLTNGTSGLHRHCTCSACQYRTQMENATLQMNQRLGVFSQQLIAPSGVTWSNPWITNGHLQYFPGTTTTTT